MTYLLGSPSSLYSISPSFLQWENVSPVGVDGRYEPPPIDPAYCSVKEENHPLMDPAPHHFSHVAHHLPIRKQDVRKVQNNPNRVSEKKRGQGYKEDRTEQPHSTTTHLCKSRFELVQNAVQEKTGKCNPHGYGTCLEWRYNTVSLVVQAK